MFRNQYYPSVSREHRSRDEIISCPVSNGLILSLLLLTLISCFSCVENGQGKATVNVIAPEKDESLNMVTAKEKFDLYCTQCHGEGGQGLIGPNLTDDHWIHGNQHSQVSKVIREGVPAKGMLAWQNILTNDEIDWISTYVLHLEPGKTIGAKAPEGYLYSEDGKILKDSFTEISYSPDLQISGVALEGDISRGQKLFNGSFGCARCHGRDIQGLKDNRDLKRMTLRYGNEAGLVFDLVTRDGRPGTAMPPWIHLDQQDLMDLKSFIFSIQVVANNEEL